MVGRRAPRARSPRPRSLHVLRPAPAAELVRDACLGPDDLVVDLGAGSGRLTAELAHAAGRVVAVELDPALAAGLRGRWPNVDVIEGDAARMLLPREPFRVVSNLPFGRTNDLLHLLLDRPETPLLRADLVVEWGVAVKRGLPWPSTVNGVLWGSTYETTVARGLPREAFEPPPSVDAAVLVLRRRAEPLVPPGLASAYAAFVARGFRHGLRSVAPARAVPRATAARDLDAHCWAALFLRTRTGMMNPWRPQRSSPPPSSRLSRPSR